MLLQDSDPKQAHAFAKEAFELNPQEMLYRSLLVKLGGASSVENITRSDDVLEANGDFYWSNREYFAAQAEYSVAYKLNPKNAQAAFKAGRSMWELNFSKEAIEWMQKSIKADPKFIEAYVTLAEYYTQVFDFQAAFNSLSRAQALAKNDYRIFRGICEMELARNNLVSALNSSKAAVSLYDADVDTYLCMSQAFLKQNQLIDAYRASVQAVTYEPTNIEAQALYAEVLARYSGKEIGVQYITNLINTYPSVLEYRLSLARIFNHLENYSESRSVLQQVVDSEIRNKKIFLELAKIYQKQNDLQNALKYYLAAAELDPRDPAIIVAIGTLYLDSRKAADAAIQFEKASQRNPMYPNIYFLTAKAYYIAGDLSRAQQEAKKEMQRNPKIADSYLLLADIAMDNKNYLEASGLYRQAIELRPQSANIYVRLAKTHRLLGNYDVANQMLSLAAQKESGLPDIYKEMGALFETQSKAAEAIEAYRKYLILAPNASDRALINAIISKMGG